MDNLQHKLKKQELKELPKTVKKRFTRRNALGTITGTLIAITPFIFYFYESVPDTKVWNTFLFTYNSGFYESAQISIWILMMKAVPLYLLIIWFFTCRDWWYHALLVPIIMYLFQVIGAINSDMEFIDEFGILYMLPVMAVIIPSIYLIRAKMFNRINEADKSLQELEDEFMIRPKGFFKKLKDYF